MKIFKRKEYTSAVKAYKSDCLKKIFVILALLIATFLFFIIAVSVGASDLSFGEVLKAFFGKGDEVSTVIVYKLRLPRALAAVIAGGGLAIAGCVMQSVLKNPMASPTTLGVGNASVFGANFAIIVLGFGAYSANQTEGAFLTNPYVVSICAFVAAIIAVAVILAFTRVKRFSAEAIVLSGVAIGAIFQAATTVMQYFASDVQVASAVYWTFGSLSRANFTEDIIMVVVVGVSFIVFMVLNLDFSAMSGDIEVARTLGVRTDVMTIIGLLLSSLITAVCVAFLGMIGFIGLIAPQIMKRIVGNSFKFLLPASFLAGAIILSIADILGRVIIPGVVLPVGAVTSLVGGPLFIYLLLTARRGKA